MLKSTFVTAACFLLAVSIANGAARVANVELSYRNDCSVARIDIEGTVRFTHQTAVAKDGRPFRVIVDILTAVHHLGAKEFLSLPDCPVRHIRTSQYSVKPEKITRVVFDMERETTYRVESDNNSVSIFFPDKSRQPFEAWSTSAFLVAQARAQTPVAVTKPSEKPAATTTKQTAPKVVRELTSTELNALIAKDRQESLQSKTAPVTKAPTPLAVKATAPAQETTAKEAGHKTSSPVRSQKLFSDKDKWAGLFEHPETDKADPVKQAGARTQKDVPSSSDQKTADTQPSAVLETQPPVAVKTADKPTPAIKSEDTKTKPALTATSQDEGAKTPARSDTRAVKKPASKTKPASSPVKNQKVTQDSSASPARSKVKTDKAPEPVEPAGKPTPEADEIKTKPDNKSTSRFRRSPTMSKKIKGTLVAEFPKRLVVKYKTKNYRDPFEALINDARMLSNPIERRVPSVEGLKLVGVIQAGSGANSALFEGTDGYGYILRAGDRVQKGYVLRVESDRVFFQLFEYGWSRTMALNIED